MFNVVIAPEAVPVSLTRPEIQGDYTVTLFPFVKMLKSGPPQIAASIIASLKDDTRIDHLELAGGFLNITLSEEYWKDRLLSVTTDISVSENFEVKRYIVEFASPNTNKPLHLGHIRNILLGISTANILKSLGHDVIKAQVINDRGIAICKSMLAYSRFSEYNTPVEAGIKGDHFVGDLYVLFDQKFKSEFLEWQNNPKANEVYQSNHKTDESPKDFFARYKNTYFNEYSTLGREAREMLNRWEAGDAETLALWNKMNGWVYEGFDETYKNLGVEFDRNYYESETYLLGKKAIEAGLKKGKFVQDPDNSVWIDLTDKGLDRKILLRSDGTSVYITQDIGLALQRYDEYRFDRMVYVVGDEQNYHFQVLFATLDALGETFAQDLFHLSYGMVELPTGRMKSREGTVVDADDLITEVINEAKSSGAEKGDMANLSAEAQQEIYRKIGLAALKYHMIKVFPKKKMIFDPKESVDMQGQTGPYIQNAYVRIQSILRKSGSVALSDKASESPLQPQETALVKILAQYGETVEEAGKTYDPSHLANYLYALAKTFHKYYHDVPILTASTESEKNQRLYLIRKVGIFLEHGMALLGIEMPERM